MQIRGESRCNLKLGITYICEYLQQKVFSGSALKGKLAPRYIGPFEILEICGPVAYWIRLPSRLAAVHDVFHISQLKKCVKVPEEIIEQQDLEVEPDLSYVESPMKILNSKERSTRWEKVRMYKIQWNHHIEEEATWETEYYLQQNFPDFLRTNPGT